MSLRDFNSADDRIIPLQHEPLGNSDGLGSFHTVQPEDLAPSNTPKIVGAVAVALMIGVAGVSIYAHSGSSMQTKPVVTVSNVPAPVQQAAITPDTKPDANMPASAPVTPPPSAQATKAAKTATVEPNSLRAALVKTPAPVKSASTAHSHIAAAGSSAASDRMAADSNQANPQPQQQAVVNPPTPSPSDVATTNTQSSVAVPQGATTASDVPTPAPQPDTQSATPAEPPAQPAGQQ